MKRRKPIKRVSDRRAAQLNEYFGLRERYLAAHPYCEVWLAEHAMECLKTASASGAPRSCEIHHRRGRVGRQLLDTNFFLAVCRANHERIHANPKWAYEKGFLIRK